MTGMILRAITSPAVTIPALAVALMTGLLALWYTVTTDQFFIICLACSGVLAAAAARIFATSTSFRHPDISDADADKAADEHMAPLRQPGDAEKKLATDLEQRRMLLQHGRITEARAAVLARKVVRRTVRNRLHPPQRGRHAAPPVRPPRAARTIGSAVTEQFPAIPAVPPEPTEAIPVVPGTVFDDWHTGEFELDIRLLGASHPDGAS